MGRIRARPGLIGCGGLQSLKRPDPTRPDPRVLTRPVNSPEKKNNAYYLDRLRFANRLSSRSALQELSPLHLQRRTRPSKRCALPRNVCLYSPPRLCLGPASSGPTRLHLALCARAGGRGGVYSISYLAVVA